MNRIYRNHYYYSQFVWLLTTPPNVEVTRRSSAIERYAAMWHQLRIIFLTFNNLK